MDVVSKSEMLHRRVHWAVSQTKCTLRWSSKRIENTLWAHGRYSVPTGYLMENECLLAPWDRNPRWPKMSNSARSDKECELHEEAELELLRVKAGSGDSTNQ